MVKVIKQRLLVATHNEGKIAEYADIFGDSGIDWLTLEEVGIEKDVAETGATFYENAVLKAVAYAQQTGLLTLADDSGLEVDALGGEPGVLTARYGGPGLSIAERYRLLLNNLSDVPQNQRQARFRCVVALAAPDGTLLGTAEGVCEGMIGYEPVGDGGFGYDPVFYMPEKGLTMAQLPAAEKHRLSHRGRATRAIGPFLKRALDGN